MNSEELQRAAELLVEKNDAANQKNRELMAEVERLTSELDAALEREQALAAHVEEMKAVERDEPCYGLMIMDILDMTPSTSALTKRDLIKQADGMHQAICVLEAEFDPCHPIIERLESLEQRERQQAETQDD